MVIKGELVLIEEEDRELYNDLPEHIQVKIDQGKMNIKKPTIIHWILPDIIIRRHTREDFRDRDFEALRKFADGSFPGLVKVSKEDVEEYLCFKKKIQKMEDEEFLQFLCKTGVKLYEEGKTVEELKLMVNKRELAIVE